MYEYLFHKALAVTEELITDKETAQSNQQRLMREQLKTAEGEVLRYKQELTSEKETSFKRVQETESDRIRLKTENMIMQERATASKAEIEELRAKVNGEYATKLAELEKTNRALQEEVRKRETEMMSMSST